MIEINDINNLKITEATGITLGKFDGVHLGHVKLIETLKKEAEDMGLKTAVLAFTRNPKETLSGSRESYILNEEEKKQIFSDMGIDYYISIPFTKELSLKEPDSFVKDVLLDQFNARLLVTGADFRFGHNRAGNKEILEKLSLKYEFKYIPVELAMYDGQTISSTRIRDDIKEGKYSEAREMLGRNVKEFA